VQIASRAPGSAYQRNRFNSGDLAILICRWVTIEKHWRRRRREKTGLLLRLHHFSDLQSIGLQRSRSCRLMATASNYTGAYQGDLQRYRFWVHYPNIALLVCCRRLLFLVAVWCAFGRIKSGSVRWILPVVDTELADQEAFLGSSELKEYILLPPSLSPPTTRHSSTQYSTGRSSRELKQCSRVVKQEHLIVSYLKYQLSRSILIQ